MTMTSGHPAARWSTSSFGACADTSPAELDALGAHLHACHEQRGRWFDLRCRADLMHGFLAARLVSSLLAVALLIGLALLTLR